MVPNDDDLCRRHEGFETYQLKNHTRPYMLMGFRPGIDLALWLIGLTSGALNSNIGLYMLAVVAEIGLW